MGSARNPTSRLTLQFLEQCYHFEILTSINTLSCFISSSLVQLVKKKVDLYILYDLLEHIDLGQSKKLGTSLFAHWDLTMHGDFLLILPMFIRPLLAHF